MLFIEPGLLLVAVIVLPLAAMALVPLLPVVAARRVGLGVAAVQLVAAGVLAWMYGAPQQGAGVAFSVRHAWFGVEHSFAGPMRFNMHLGLDGLSAPLLVLAAVVLFVATAWRAGGPHWASKGAVALMLLLNAGVVGALASLDFLSLGVSLCTVVLALYALIGRHGRADRSRAATRFAVTATAAVGLVLFGAVLVVQSSGVASHGNTVRTIDIPELSHPANYQAGGPASPGRRDAGEGAARGLAFACCVLGFAILMAAVPLHTWLADTAQQAPIPAAMVLLGIVVALGGYGMLRVVCGLFPDQLLRPVVAQAFAFAGVGALVYGALLALSQRDLTRIVACTAVSHGGLVLLGVASMQPAGLAGAQFAMIGHGLLSVLLLTLVGALDARVGSRTLAGFGGLAQLMPGFAVLAAVCGAGLLGLPGTAGWWGVWLVLVGAFSNEAILTLACIGIVGLMLNGAQVFRMMRDLLAGTPRTRQWAPLLSGLRGSELWPGIALVALILLLGFWPSVLLDLAMPTMTTIASALAWKAGAVVAMLH